RRICASSSPRRNAERVARRTESIMVSLPETGGAIAADDLYRLASHALQCARALAGEKGLDRGASAVVVEVHLVGVSEDQGDVSELLGEDEEFGFLREHEERDLRISPPPTAVPIGGAPCGEHDDVVQERHGHHLLTSGIAKGREDVDVIVGLDEAADRASLRDVHGDGAGATEDALGESALVLRGAEMRPEDGIALAQRNQYALSDDGIAVRGANHGIGDESRRHLGGDDLTRADRLALLHVLGSDDELDELPFLAGALLACAQRSVHP